MSNYVSLDSMADSDNMRSDDEEDSSDEDSIRVSNSEVHLCNDMELR